MRQRAGWAGQQSRFWSIDQRISWRSSFSQRTVWLRLIGPGRVAVASVFGRTSSDQITGNSPATTRQW